MAKLRERAGIACFFVLLCACIHSASAAPFPDEELYLAARTYEDAGDFVNAAKAYDSCVAAGGPLARYATVRGAVCRAQAPDGVGGAITRLEKIVAQDAGGAWTLLAKVELGRILITEAQHEAAGKILASVLRNAPKLWWLDEYRFLEAENALATDEGADAGRSYFRDAVQTAVFRRDKVRAALALAASPEVRDGLLAAETLISANRRREARELLEDVKTRAEASPALEARWRVAHGRLLIREGGRAKGEAVLRDVARDSGDEAYAAKALSALLQSRLQVKDAAASERIAIELHDNFATSEETAEAHWNLAKFYGDSGSTSNAIKHLLMIADGDFGNSRRSRSLLRAGNLLRAKGSTDQALEFYERLLQSFPASGYVSEGAFWAGALSEELAALDKARGYYRLAVAAGVGEYYAHRAQARLADLDSALASVGATLAGGLVAEIPRSTPVPMVPILSEAGKRLSFFALHGFEEAEWEALYWEQSLAPSDDHSALYAVMGESGAAYSAMQMSVSEVSPAQDGAEEERLRVRFPRAYWPHVRAAAEATGVDPYLVLAVARQETTFRPALTSSAGAMGIMQVMPSTARWLAEVERKVSPAQAKVMERPENAIWVGTFYLRRMLNRSEGNLVYALASYNAGPGNCDKWLRRFPGVDLATFVESIPFDETRAYVKRVLGFYAAYRSLYPPAPPR